MTAPKAIKEDPHGAEESAKYQNPIPSRLFILQTLAQMIQDEQATTLDALAMQLGVIYDDEKFFAFNNRLKAMLRDGQIECADGIHYSIAPIPQEYTGKVIANAKGFGFVVLENMPDLFLHEKQMRLVFDGDTVQASAVEFRGKTEGRIQAIIARHQSEFIGVLQMDEEGFYYCQLSGANAHQPISLHGDVIQAQGVALGATIKVRLTEMPDRENFAVGELVAVLDDYNDREMIVETALLNYAIPYEFSDEAIHEATSFGEPSAHDFKGRVDLRDLPLVTIDGEDSRDFDDAVYACKRAGGNYRVVVAIADVSHYVVPNSALDKDAYERGTSVYFPHHVVPMLPEALSNGLCSLNPKVDRLCMVADMKVSRLGKVTDYKLYPAVMHSQARLTYNQVNAYFDDPTNDTLPNDMMDNVDVLKSLDTLYQLYTVLDKKRDERGAMAFETAETYIKFAEDGDIADIVKRTRGDAHKLIEECMLLANTCAAKFALQHDLPVLYRNHDKPDDAKASKLAEYVKSFGLSFPTENPTHDDYQRIIKAVAHRPDVASVHSMLLRSMMQANYSPDNIGHFGLAYDEYSHFTSPIRRYPDLMLHRAIKDKVMGQKPAPTIYKSLEEAGEQTSMTERRAEEASRFVESWLKCHYMMRHIGDEFEGVIASVTSFGLFVTLNDLFIDGLVHISNLGNEYFTYDERQQQLIGETGSVYGLGDEICIKVASVNMDLLQIDFLPVINRRSKKRKTGIHSANQRNQDASKDKASKDKAPKDKTTGAKPKAPKDKAPKDKAPKDKKPK